jgi:hypothetical protein
MLAVMITRAKNDDQVTGVVPHLVEDGLSILQYADDTVIFMDHDFEKATNMKLILCVFEQLSGLKINFHKSELFCFGEAKQCEQQYAQLFGCSIGTYPFRYLGIPMHTRKLSNKDWQSVEERFEKKLSSWKGKLLSVGGRLVLINSVLSSLPMFMMSFFEVPKGVLQRIEFFRSRFFWQNDQHKKKYRLVKWSVVCQPKEQGGLGVTNLEIQNRCLLSKWLVKLCNEDGLWQQVIRNKYLRNKTIGEVQKRATDSHFWKGLLNVKQQVLQLGKFKVQNGKQTRFWEDIWIGNSSLRTKFPRLFNIVHRKQDTMSKVLSSIPLNVSFRRALVGNNLRDWNRIVATVVNIQLQDERDVFVWSLNSNGLFTVRSMYVFLVNSGVRVSQEIWRAKLPMKIKVFMWYLKKGVILTKDNLAKRNWRGNKGCSFCNTPESIQHLFFNCAYAKFLWTAVHMVLGIAQPTDVNDLFNHWSKRGGTIHNLNSLTAAAALCWSLWISRNEIVFDKCTPKTFMQVLFRGTYWLRQWAKLQHHEDRQQELVDACRVLEASCLQLFLSFGWSSAFRIT